MSIPAQIKGLWRDKFRETTTQSIPYWATLLYAIVFLSGAARTQTQNTQPPHIAWDKKEQSMSARARAATAHSHNNRVTHPELRSWPLTPGVITSASQRDKAPTISVRSPCLSFVCILKTLINAQIETILTHTVIFNAMYLRTNLELL